MNKSTPVIYVGDSGFTLGEHGFCGKPDAFEESICVPMPASAPPMTTPATKVRQMVQNTDIAAMI